MQTWHVNLLGVPSASRDGENVRLRSKATWAVLASLLLPESLSGRQFSLHPPILSRETLALRFWGNSTNSPRACLRQSIASLRAVFGDDYIFSVGGRLDIHALSGGFVTDIERMLVSYHTAMLSPSLEERVYHLTEAEGEIHGEFLEGCLEPGDPGDLWLLSRRADLRTKIVLVLTALLDALSEQGNRNAALDVARRALLFHPADAILQNRAWQLAVATGQEDALRAIKDAENFSGAIARLRNRDANTMTSGESRLFKSLFLTQISQLPTKLKESFLHLAVFPTSFTTQQAYDICHVPKAALEALVNTSLVEREEGSDSRSNGRYFLSKVVRDAALRELKVPIGKRLSKRLAAYCDDWILSVRTTQPTVPPAPFETPARALPFFRAALEWHLTQQGATTTKLLDLLGRLDFLGLIDLAHETVPYLRQVYKNEMIPLSIRHQIISIAGHTLYLCGDYPNAIECLRAATFAEATSGEAIPPEERMAHHSRLALAYHYMGDSRTALLYLREAYDYHKHAGQTVRVAELLRIQGEILNHLEEYEEALQVCEQALSIRRVTYEESDAPKKGDGVADALFWKGSTLFRLGRFDVATHSIREALTLWQESNNRTGIGHCLRLLGRLRAEENVFSEALSHLHHAILIHDNTGSTGCRIAAVEALADVHFREGKLGKAKVFYRECLAYHVRRKPPHPEKVEKLTKRVALCEGVVDVVG